MSEQITTAYNEQYHSGVQMLVQQLSAKLRGAVTTMPVAGKRDYFDQVGRVRSQKKTGRAVNLPIVETPHARRSFTASDYYLRDFVDEFDKLKVLNDPTNAYLIAQGGALARDYDTEVINAALGTAYVGETGATAVPLPTSQKIADGATGFTLPKLKQAVRMLKSKNALMPGDTINCAWTARQEEEFTNASEVTSSDFNSTKVLRDGGVDEFYKVQFHLIEDFEDNDPGRIIPKVGTVRSCPIWTKSAIYIGEWKPAFGKVAYIDERFAWQIASGQSIGATRMQEEQVVQVDVQEA